MNNLLKLLAAELRNIADKIESGSCELTPEEAMNVLDIVSHEAMSKEQACSFLNISRATFDLHVKLGHIPRGRKRVGFKELVWYKDELRKCVDDVSG
ncbi:MAG: hypothetical protein HDS07_03135 [Bacteroides sp.]|nr:hypothetical protein [Bacteroides sp.]